MVLWSVVQKEQSKAYSKVKQMVDYLVTVMVT